MMDNNILICIWVLFGFFFRNFALPGKLPLARPTPRAVWRIAPRPPAAPPRPTLLGATPRTGGPPARPRATTPRPRPAC